jgi:hypothetical protein
MLSNNNNYEIYEKHDEDYFFEKEVSAKDFLVPRIFPLGKNKKLATFFQEKRETGDIIDNPLSLSEEDKKVILEKETVFDSFFQVDKDRDARGIHLSYYLPNYQPHIEGWIIQQNNYFKTLNQRDKDALSAYSFHGDVFINGYLRGNLHEDIGDLVKACHKSGDIPFKWAIYDNYDKLKEKEIIMPLKESFIKNGKIDNKVILDILADDNNWQFFFSRSNIDFLILGLVADLTRVIFNAPRLRKPLTVYRGVKSEHFDTLKTKSIDYWSTSLDPYASTRFADSDVGKLIAATVYEITVEPNIPCLYLERFSKFKSSEAEVLLPPGTNYTFNKNLYIKTRVEEKPYYKLSFDEFVVRAMSSAQKRRVLVISGIATEFDPHVLTLKDILEKWDLEAKRKEKRARIFELKYGGLRVSREDKLVPKLKLRKAKTYEQTRKTRKLRTSRERNLSRRHHRFQKKAGSRNSRENVEDTNPHLKTENYNN